MDADLGGPTPSIVRLLHDITSGSDITPCNKIDKTQVVYRFSGNVTFQC